SRTMAEQFYDLEFGYRAEISPRISFDLATFAGLYRRLETTETQTARVLQQPAGLMVIIPETFFNNARAHTYGGEFSANWQVTPRWRLLAGYSYLQVHVAHYFQIQGANPVHGAQLRSLLNVTPNLEFDNSLYYAENAPQGAGRTSRNVRWDTRLGWRVGESLELSFTGQNLLRPQTLEFSDIYGLIATQVERSIFGKITWRF
ncbi:MAG TPA: TonB-dependent receptor, partial [Bryobacteraceae bacterium]|nr:TonB-dependent receptor [Bryobacteraceae bacterium]